MTNSYNLPDIELLVSMADGFGSITYKKFEGINGGWDWSHFRDSTNKAVLNMASYLQTI